MSVQPTQDIRPLLTRLDAIMRELAILRQQLATSSSSTPFNLTDQLFGVLGTGQWDEYDLDLEWQRFAL